MGLRSGDCQVAPTLAGIRGDHLARYRFALERGHLWPVLDAGCGIGYGARILADAGFQVHAWDHDPEKIAYGQTHYDHPAIRWSVADICAVTCWQAMTAIAFEVLEHLESPGQALRRFPDRLIASVPNELVVPKLPGTFPHHVRHYSPDAFMTLLTRAGYRVVEFWSQDDLTDKPPHAGEDGRTLVAVCSR
jgi:SAM-dependent methyltransferase